MIAKKWALEILMDYTNHPDKELAKYAQQQVDMMKTKLINYEHKDKKIIEKFKI